MSDAGTRAALRLLMEQTIDQPMKPAAPSLKRGWVDSGSEVCS